MIKNKFCIVVTAYNAQNYIKDCLLSIQQQRYANWSCVVIDDCSTDSTFTVIKETVENDNRFQIIRNPERKYCLVNRIYGNHFICTNDEDIIVDVDGDDKLADNKALDYLNQVYQNDVWVTYGQFKLKNQENSFHCRKYDSPFLRYDYEKHNLSHLRTYKYWLFKKIKDEDLKAKNGKYPNCVGDMYVMFPLCEMAGNHVTFTPMVLYEYNNLSILNDNVDKPQDCNFYNQDLFQKTTYPLIDNKMNDFKKISIKIFDKNFRPFTPYTNNKDVPDFIEWYEGPEHRNFTFYTDKCLEEINNKNPNSVNVGWLMEPIAVSPLCYEFILKNYHLFNYILTHEKDILDKVPNSVWVPQASCWLWKKDWQIYPKTKKVCLSMSTTCDCEGHKLRYDILKQCKEYVTDVKGLVDSKFNYRLEVLKDYNYVVEVQAYKRDYFYTERLIDAFMTGTIPIYWGYPSIDKKFNSKGILSFNTIEELKNILINLSTEDYASRMPAIQDNFIRAHQYASLENYIYNHFIRKIQTGNPVI